LTENIPNKKKWNKKLEIKLKIKSTKKSQKKSKKIGQPSAAILRSSCKHLGVSRLAGCIEKYNSCSFLLVTVL
jgi:hypothetical protein